MPEIALAWPHNRQLTDDRETYDASRFLPCYANAGQYPTRRKGYVIPFHPQPNRASRRRGERGAQGDHDVSIRSLKAAKWDNTPRTSVVARRLRRDPFASVS